MGTTTKVILAVGGVAVLAMLLKQRSTPTQLVAPPARNSGSGMFGFARQAIGLVGEIQKLGASNRDDDRAVASLQDETRERAEDEAQKLYDVTTSWL